MPVKMIPEVDQILFADEIKFGPIFFRLVAGIRHVAGYK